jgi:hypothetical protein
VPVHVHVHVPFDPTSSHNRLKQYQHDYRQTLTQLTVIKKNIVDIDSRLNEAMREVRPGDVARALDQRVTLRLDLCRGKNTTVGRSSTSTSTSAVCRVNHFPSIDERTRNDLI